MISMPGRHRCPDGLGYHESRLNATRESAGREARGTSDGATVTLYLLPSVFESGIGCRTRAPGRDPGGIPAIVVP